MFLFNKIIAKSQLRARHKKCWNCPSNALATRTAFCFCHVTFLGNPKTANRGVIWKDEEKSFTTMVEIASYLLHMSCRDGSELRDTAWFWGARSTAQKFSWCRMQYRPVNQRRISSILSNSLNLQFFLPMKTGPEIRGKFNSLIALYYILLLHI